MSSSFLPDVNLGVAQSAGFNLDGFGASAAGGLASAGGASILGFDPITFGLGAATNLLGLFGQQQQVNQQNQAAINQYRQQLHINAMQNAQQIGEYTHRVSAAQRQMQAVALGKNLADAQEQLQLNELFKQARLATQTSNINRAQAVGRVAASGQQGVSGARNIAMTAAQFGREAAARRQRLTGAITASELRNQARALQANTKRQSIHDTIAFAPQPIPAPIAPTLAQGPGFADFATGMLGPVASAFGTGTQNNIYRQQLASTNFLG